MALTKRQLMMFFILFPIAALMFIHHTLVSLSVFSPPPSVNHALSENIHLENDETATVSTEITVTTKKRKPEKPEQQTNTASNTATKQTESVLDMYTCLKHDAATDFFAQQLKLLEQLPGPASRDYSRPAAPQTQSTDHQVRDQMCGRNVCKSLIKNAPWTRTDLLKALREFTRDVYPFRPIGNNNLGMGFNHAFLSWFYAKQRQPKYIIENGIHLGQSTWLLRKAVPHAKIFSFDPKGSIIRYWDKNVTYWVGDNVKKAGYMINGWKDFNEIEWDLYIPNNDEALILFDDHQNHLRRLKEAHERGFKYAMFDDNWPELQGDNYSIKQMCDETGGHALRSPDFPDKQRVLKCDNFHMKDEFITLQQHQANREWLLSVVKWYFEGPPPLFYPPHLEFTKFGHKPKKDTTPVQLVLPKPSQQLLLYIADAIIPKPIVQTQEEFDFVGLGMKSSGLKHADFGGHVCPCYVELRQ
eukprot:TRINITY_DN94256_c0_g1_i1.p1 TRINITY_DN94256_c0_g1~~TRINITY_DN94256_c0_g1_i1.p1  ORF type:complete len:471 (-),score=62.49 TRINITY_DN94256_c0_g1_i1:161-1573(-)